jgi:hypothetical protein
VATTPKLVVAPAALTSTLLVTPPATVTDVENLAGTPVDVIVDPFACDVAELAPMAFDPEAVFEEGDEVVKDSGP